VATVAACLIPAAAAAGAPPGAGASVPAGATAEGAAALLGSSATVPGPAPLTTTWTGTQGSWAVVPMGHRDQSLNTFWQLLFRPVGASAWQLVTPVGVADNGGLVADGGSTATVTAGFEPTQDLRYSPLARSTDSGSRWSTGILPAGLLAVPDAVSGTPGGGTLALVRSSGGSLVTSTGNLSSWRVLARRASLVATPAGRACGLVALRAIAAIAGSPEVGGSCTRPGVVGILVDKGGRWSAAGVRLPGETAHLETSVLRLEAGASGTRALVQAGLGRAARLLALWRAGPSQAWTVSAALRTQGPVQASGFGPSGAVVVVTRAAKPRGEVVADVVEQGGAWSALPPAPGGTAAVVEGPDGEVDALAVSGKVLTDYRLDGADGTWHRLQALSVPIQYGSST
jgi:hypothetical protein